MYIYIYILYIFIYICIYIYTYTYVNIHSFAWLLVLDAPQYTPQHYISSRYLSLSFSLHFRISLSHTVSLEMYIYT